LIPLSSLAAVLLLTGYKLCKLSVFQKMWANGKYQFIPFIVTVLTILAIDLFGIHKPLKGEGLLIGVIAGLIAAVGALLHGNLKNSYFYQTEKHDDGDVIVIKLAEEVSFLNKAAIRQTLDEIVEKSKIVIDATNTKYIEFDVLEQIKEFRDIKAPLKNIQLTLIGFKDLK
jgi:carbonic anhydrase